jgi:hypothetical protein
MANPLGLHAAELEALRDLQTGKYRLEPDDPVWEALQELGLVEEPQTKVRIWMLTALGRRYRTD